MDEAELQARILIALFRIRTSNDGRMDLDPMLASGGAPVTIGEIAASARYLADKDLINFWPAGSGNVGVAGKGEITGQGVDYVKSKSSREFPTLEEMLLTRIDVSAAAQVSFGAAPPPPPLGVFATGQVGDLSSRTNSNANVGPFFLNQDNSADAVIRARELARQTIAGRAAEFSNNGYVPRPPDEIAADERKARMVANILLRPGEVAESVQQLASELRAQIQAMQSNKPNDNESLWKFSGLTTFLESSANQLDDIAKTLETTVATPDNSTQRFLAGKAAEAFDQLGIAFNKWVDENKDQLPGQLFRVGLFTAVAVVLHKLDLDYLTGAGILSLAYVNFKDSKSKKDK
jgi:hypothetical protein